MTRRFTPEQKHKIVELYESGLSLTDIAKAFHSKSPQLFSVLLKEMGIKIRAASPIEYIPTVEEIYGGITAKIQETWDESEERLRRTGTKEFIPWTPLEVESPDTINRKASTR